MLLKKFIKTTLAISQFEASRFNWWLQRRFQKCIVFLRGLLGNSQV